MLDLEFFAHVPNSKLVSIGAVIFDPRYGYIGDKFYVELDHKAQKNRVSDPDTIAWWKKQSKEVKKALKGTTRLEDALEDLAFFLPDDCKVWGNGPIADIAKLEDAYTEYDIEIPWKFWNVRDVRTIKDLYESDRGGLEKAMKGTCHNALDDAYYQAQIVIKMWKAILKR